MKKAKTPARSASRTKTTNRTKSVKTTKRPATRARKSAPKRSGWNVFARFTSNGLFRPVAFVICLLAALSVPTYMVLAGTPAVGNGYVFKSKVGKCLDNQSATKKSGNTVWSYNCNGTIAQEWTMSGDGTIRNQGFCLDVKGAGKTSGTTVWLYTCNKSVAQQWQMRSNGTIINPNSSRCLDVKGASSANGTPIQIWTCNTTAAQIWTRTASKAPANPTPTPTPTEPTPPPPTSGEISSLRTVAQWEQLYLKKWNAEHTGEYLALSQKADSWGFYNLGYAIDANVAMFRATGKTQYLDRALLYANNVVGTAKKSSAIKTSQYKDSYMTWPSFSHPDKKDGGEEYPLYESYMWRYVTYMLRTMHDTPSVMQNTSYKAQYDKILDFSEKNMFDKWYNRSANDNVYRQNTHMASHWAYISMELAAMTTNNTRKATYTKVYTNINKKLPNYPGGLRTQMKPNPANANAYFFHPDWGKSSRPGSDVSHANGVLSYIVEARDSNVEWTSADITKFNVMLKNVIWKSGGSSAQFVDGSGSDSGWINDGLMKLGRYDVAIQKRLESYNTGQNIQFYGNAALNVKILSTKK
jgi:hypothetical protein